MQRLGELLDLPEHQFEVSWAPAEQRDLSFDALVRVPGFTFAIEFKARSDLATIARGLSEIRRRSQGKVGKVDRDWIWVLATRYMTESGRQRCQQAGVSWLDLAGNASIRGPGLYLYVEGRPDICKPVGRPRSVFAPKSSRIARWLLIHFDRHFTQRELAQATSMGEGFTSRIVSRLEDLRLIRRDRKGRVRASNPDLLLDAWAQEYDFFRHRVYRSHVPARTGLDLLLATQSRLHQQGWDTAATGLAAAWLHSHFAGFRIATLYLRAVGASPLMDLSTQDEPVGANLWLVIPNDEGVFHGGRSQPPEGVVCVHPVQAWLDLQAHPERSSEAAQQLRAQLPWRSDHG